MDILGIGPLEFLFILIIALIVLGPKDMVKAGRTIGRTLRTIVSSETWRVVQDASREIRNLPNRMMREAALEDLQKQLPSQSTIKNQLGIDELEKSLNDSLNSPQSDTAGKDLSESQSGDLTAWTTPPPTIGRPEHMQSTDTGTGGASDNISSWTETSKSIASSVQPPNEAEPAADPHLPGPDNQQTEVESADEPEEIPAEERPEHPGAQADNKEEQHDIQQTRSE